MTDGRTHIPLRIPPYDSFQVREVMQYLGLTLAIGDDDIEIWNPRTGRRLAVERSMRQARLFCRGYRRAGR